MGTSVGAVKAWKNRKRGTKTDLPGNKKQTKKRPKTFSKKDIIPYSKLTPAQRKKIDQKTSPKTTKKKPTTFKKISKKDKAKFDKMAKQSLADVKRKRAAKIRKNPKLAATFKQAQTVMRQGKSGRGKRRKQMIPQDSIAIRGTKAAKKKMIAKWNGQSTSKGAYKLTAGSAKRTEHGLRLAKDWYKNSILIHGKPDHPELVDIVDKDGEHSLTGDYWKPKEKTLYATLLEYDDFGQAPSSIQQHFTNSFVKLGKYGTKKTGELLEMLLQELDTMATKSDNVLVRPEGKLVGMCDGYRCKTMPIQHKDPEDQLGKAVGIRDRGSRESEAGTTQGAIKAWITRRGGRKPTERQVSRKTNQILQTSKDQIHHISNDLWKEMGFSNSREMRDSYDGNPKEFFENILKTLKLRKGLKTSILGSKRKWVTKQGLYSDKANQMSDALLGLEEEVQKLDIMKNGQVYIHKSGTWLFLGSSDEMSRKTINSLENLKHPLKNINLFERGVVAENAAISGGYERGELTVYGSTVYAQGVLAHELGHHIYEYMKPQDKTQWQKEVGKLRKEKTARNVSYYIKKMVEEKDWKVAENVLREEVFCELRTAQHSIPSKFKKLSRSSETRELVKTFLNYQSIKGYESMQGIDSMQNVDSMHVTFLYDVNGTPTQNTDKAVRASVYTDGRHEIVDMTQDKLDDIAEYLSEATSFYKRQSDKKAQKDADFYSRRTKKAWKKRKRNQRKKNNQKSYKPTGDPAKKTQMQKDKERKDKMISTLQKKELPKKHIKFLNKYGLGKHSFARFSTNVILNDWKTNTSNIESWYNGLPYDHKIILDRLSGTKEQIKSIPKGSNKILKTYGKGLKWNDMDKISRDQITNSVPEILRDISSQKIDEGTSDTWSKIGMNARKTVLRQVWNAMSVDADYSQKFIEREVLTMSWQQIPHDVRRDIDNILRQNFSIELTLPQLDRGKLKKVAKTIGVPLATLLTNDKLMDIYPEILASKTATYLPHALSQIPALASKETESGTPEGAKKAWLKRKRGIKDEDEPKKINRKIEASVLKRLGTKELSHYTRQMKFNSTQAAKYAREEIMAINKKLKLDKNSKSGKIIETFMDKMDKSDPNALDVLWEEYENHLSDYEDDYPLDMLSFDSLDEITENIKLLKKLLNSSYKPDGKMFYDMPKYEDIRGILFSYENYVHAKESIKAGRIKKHKSGTNIIYDKYVKKHLIDTVIKELDDLPFGVNRGYEYINIISGTSKVDHGYNGYSQWEGGEKYMVIYDAPEDIKKHKQINGNSLSETPAYDEQGDRDKDVPKNIEQDGIIRHEMGHGIHNSRPRKIRDQWEKAVKSLGTKELKELSGYMETIVHDGRFSLQHPVNEAFAEMRRYQRTYPENWKQMRIRSRDELKYLYSHRWDSDAKKLAIGIKGLNIDNLNTDQERVMLKLKPVYDKFFERSSRETITDDQANFTWDYLAKPSEKLSTVKDVGISDSSLIDLKWKKIPKGMRGKIMSIESFEQLIMKHKELPSYSKRYQALASLKKYFAKASGTSDGADKAWRTRRGANPALDEAEDIYDKMINADGIEETRKNIVELVRGSSIKPENQMAINRMVMDWDRIQHIIAKDKGCQIDNDGNYKTNVGWSMMQNKRAGKDPNQLENVCSSSAKTLKNYMTTFPSLKQFGIKAETVKGEYLGKGKSHNVAAHQTGTGIQDINDDNKDTSKIHRFLYDNGYKKAIFGIGHEWLKLDDGTIIDGAYGQFLPRNVKNIYERIAIIPPDDPRQKWYNTTGGVPYDKDLPEEEYQKDWHLLGLEAVK